MVVVEGGPESRILVLALAACPGRRSSNMLLLVSWIRACAHRDVERRTGRGAIMGRENILHAVVYRANDGLVSGSSD